MDISPPFLTAIIDRACGPLSARLSEQRLPAIMRVNPKVFATVRSIRAREIADGYPLMFLGMELQSDAGLPLEGFTFVD